MTSDQRVVVIGGGLAGLRLAQRLDAAPSLTVTVLGEETHAPYNRVLLAEVLAGRYAPDVAALPAPGPVLRRGVRAVRVDRAERRVHCDDGAVLPYDTLVLATGSNPVLPPLRGLFTPEGRELPEGVHAFRTMDDCTALSAAVGPGVRAVVVGGGLLGVSAARALAARGAQVVLAQQGERLMEHQLDRDAAALLHAHLTALGIEIHTECRARGLTTGASGPPEGRRVTGVELADGYRLAADLVVLACGVRPRVGLARAAGLDVRTGIVVDDRLCTSDPAIHAIGDCAEHAGHVYGLAGPALHQADTLSTILTEPRPPARSGSASGSTTACTFPGAPGAPDPSGPLTGAEEAPRPTGSTGSAGSAAATASAGATGAGARYTGTRVLTRLTLPAAGPAAPGPGAAAGGGAGAPGTGSGQAPGTGSGQGPGPLDLATFGEAVPRPGDDVVRLADATRRTYRQVVVRGDRLVGGVLLGELSTVGALARSWESDEPLRDPADLFHLLTDDGGS
jgi:assimilatory nitrate reductase electron transfer subunit